MADEERVESQGFYEMLWDCDHCETKGLLAKSQRHCAECGAPQNPDKRYFPKEGEEKRVDGHSYEGADRTCPACSAPMGARREELHELRRAARRRAVEVTEASPRRRRRALQEKRRWRIWPYRRSACSRSSASSGSGSAASAARAPR